MQAPTFSTEDMLKALAIVNIFETGRPLGDHSSVAVLDDGAGISYGISQFTHRSGALAVVVRSYLDAGGTVAREQLARALPLLDTPTRAALDRLTTDETFKKALSAAAVTREMKEAQRQAAFELYLHPAIEICSRRRFHLPLSLAVVYDSVTHGSWDRIARRVKTRADERDWITDYVRTRHFWLSSIPRLKATTYRTRFFIAEIARGNWMLSLPLNVNGVRLPAPSAEPRGSSDAHSRVTEQMELAPPNDVGDDNVQPPATARGADWNAAATAFDRVDGIVTGVIRRTDRAKSLWTTVGGTLWQAAWGVFGFIAGIPREVWLAVAVIAGLLMLLFLYRQIILGRIREHLAADR
jgi:chitosanase